MTFHTHNKGLLAAGFAATAAFAIIAACSYNGLATGEVRYVTGGALTGTNNLTFGKFVGTKDECLKIEAEIEKQGRLFVASPEAEGTNVLILRCTKTSFELLTK